MIKIIKRNIRRIKKRKKKSVIDEQQEAKEQEAKRQRLDEDGTIRSEQHDVNIAKRMLEGIDELVNIAVEKEDKNYYYNVRDKYGEYGAQIWSERYKRTLEEKKKKESHQFLIGDTVSDNPIITSPLISHSSMDDNLTYEDNKREEGDRILISNSQRDLIMDENKHESIKEAISFISSNIIYPNRMDLILRDKVVTPEMFIEWRQKINNLIDGISKVRHCIHIEPLTGFINFKRDYPYFSIQTLESAFLAFHRSLWDYIASCFNSGDFRVLENEVKKEYSIQAYVVKLRFIKILDLLFYKDCSMLLTKLESFYCVKSHSRISVLQAEKTALRYNYGENPDIFLTAYDNIEIKFENLVKGYHSTPDIVKVYEILSRIPDTLEAFKETIKNTPNITYITLREKFREWWISHKDDIQKDLQEEAKTKEQKEKQQKNNNNRNHQIRPRGNPITNPNSYSYAIITQEFKDYIKPSGMINIPREQWNSLNKEKRYLIINHNKTLKDNHKDKEEQKQEHKEGQMQIDQQHYNFCAISVNHNPLALSTQLGSNVTTSYPINVTPYQFIADTASTHHFTGDKNSFINGSIMQLAQTKVRTITGDKQINTCGDLKLTDKITLNNVRYVPGSAPFNLISIGEICSNGYQALFTGKGFYILKPGTINFKTQSFPSNIILKGKKEGNIYIYNTNQEGDRDKRSDITINDDDEQEEKDNTPLSNKRRKIPRINENNNQSKPLSSSSSLSSSNPSNSSSSLLNNSPNLNTTAKAQVTFEIMDYGDESSEL
jgi:hypothetical protein